MGRRSFALRLSAPLALVALAACSPKTDTEATPAPETQGVAVHPVSGLETVPLTVTTMDKAYRFSVEYAASEEAQRQGLMFRTELGDWEGMIFPTIPPRPRSFWMKNTPLPLDIIFIGSDSRVLNIAANTVPYSLESVASMGNTIGVLELRGGRAAELGIKPGALVQWDAPQAGDPQ